MSKSPKYVRIAEKLKKRIISGALASDSSLPPCRELALSYSVSYLTMTNALRALEADGFISRRQGSGNFINPAERRMLPENREKAAFIMPVKGDIFQGFFSEIVTGLEKHNILSVPLTDSGTLEKMSGGECSERIHRYSSMGFSSLVIDGTRHFPFRALKGNEKHVRQLNFVMHYDTELDFPDANVILPDYRKAGRKAAMHLLKKGWTKIGFVTFEEMDEMRRRFNGSLKCAYDTLVLDGIEDAFRAYGLDFMSSCRVFKDNSGDIRPGLAAFVQPGATAFILMGDQRYVHIMNALGQLGLKMPGDIGCVGFYNTPQAEYWNLTSVAVCEEKVAALAAEAIIKGWKGKRLLVGPELIERESGVSEKHTKSQKNSYKGRA